jgi:SAM-dependent MidA family methyltransferase
MNFSQDRLLPLGDFKPSDEWQTHVNNIFYGTKGPAIHRHFQTYVSLDYRLAHALADDFLENVSVETNSPEPLTILEWGVGNGNLAARFLSRLKEQDSEEKVYPKVRYILCDYSEEILRGVQGNPDLQAHGDRFSTVRLNAENLEGFRPGSITKIISNEIWDDLATKVLLVHDGLLLEEYLQPLLEPDAIDIDFETFARHFANKNLEALKSCPPFLDRIFWERSFQRVDVSDWPFGDIVARHMEPAVEGIPMPINIGAFATLGRAHGLLNKRSQGYCSFDYGMLTRDELNREGRPYFKLYGGQYTSMVNFPLLEEVAKKVGFSSVTTERQQDYVGRSLGENVISAVDLVQMHPQVGRLAPWDVDILMLQTLHALNSNYRSPYTHKMDYPPMPDTPKKQRKQISQLAEKLSPRGVPDTVAYITRGEVLSAMKPLRKLGYREKDLQAAFQPSDSPIVFGRMHLQ